MSMVILIAKAYTTIKACTTHSIEAREYCLFTIYGYGVPFLFSHSKLYVYSQTHCKVKLKLRRVMKRRNNNLGKEYTDTC